MAKQDDDWLAVHFAEQPKATLRPFLAARVKAITRQSSADLCLKLRLLWAVVMGLCAAALWHVPEATGALLLGLTLLLPLIFPQNSPRRGVLAMLIMLASGTRSRARLLFPSDLRSRSLINGRFL